MVRKVNLFIKRLFDIVVSLIGIVICLPFWLITVVLMKITMPGPIFFKQERIGRRFESFNVLKFRTMKVDNEAESKFQIEKDKQRITTLGKVLRRTKIDETPQLINVFVGDMSLVGPRPTVRQRVEEFYEGQELRLQMRPGMTGISQVSGNVLLSWPRRIEYDCEYVKTFNVWKDIVILFKTVNVVIFGEEKYISKEDLEEYRNPFYDIVR